MRTFVVALCGVFLFSHRLFAQCPDGTPPPCRGARPVAAPAPNSVAVLYFDNLSRDTADAYLADGLTEQVIQRLGQVGRLVVKSKYSVRRYRGTDVDPRDVGRTLQVAYIGGGSVRRAGNRLRVNVELTRAATGDRVWGETYDRADADVLAIEEEIAGAVATEIAGRLLPAERSRIGARVTSNTAAYDHMLRGNYLLARRSADAVRRAIAEFEAAARADPGLTSALASAAYAYGVYLAWEWPWPGLPRDSLLARADRVLEQVLERDPPKAERTACSLRLAASRDAGEAARCVQRAAARDLGSAELQHQLGWSLMNVGRDSAAADAFRRALSLEPARAITLETWGRMLVRNRQFVEARRLLDSAIAADPDFPPAYLDRARVRLATGDVAGAMADGERISQLTPSLPYFVLVVALASRDTAQAAAALRRMLAGADTAYLRTTWAGASLAGAQLALGRRDDAIATLESLNFHDFELYGQLKNPEFDGLRDDPRFQRLFEAARPAAAAVWVVPQ